MNDEWIGKKHINKFDTPLFFLLKLKLFGVKRVEYSGPWKLVAYLYKDVIYITEYTNIYYD